MKTISNFVNPLLTDKYQFKMAYGYWKNKMWNKPAVFDLFFRKPPFHDTDFKGEFAVFAGLEQAMQFVKDWKMTKKQIEFIKKTIPGKEPEFYEWLGMLNCKDVRIYAPNEGTLVFPKMPLLRVEGPLAIIQLLETTLLNQINFATLMATNAARFRLAAGNAITLAEMGLRRGQGADGAMTAARSAYIGGFDSTSNMLAGYVYGIPTMGTNAHSFLTAFTGPEDLATRDFWSADGEVKVDIWKEVLKNLKTLGYKKTNKGELAAMCAFAQAFPEEFLTLVDTYDTKTSGVPNFLAVAVLLKRLGYEPLGMRLDSGDLAHLSQWAKAEIKKAGQKFGIDLSEVKVAASNDIEEKIVYSLKEQGAEIDSMGVGTHLITCKAQPALGGVYKLVMIDGKARIKFSQDAIKVTLPGAKKTMRIYVKDVEHPVVDVIMDVNEIMPTVGQKLLIRNVKNFQEKSIVTVDRVEVLNILQWDGKEIRKAPNIHQIRANTLANLAAIREDVLRPILPTPYKVAISEQVYKTMMWVVEKEATIQEIVA